MGLALDEPRQDDERHEQGGVTFLIPREIRSWLRGGTELQVDFNRFWKQFTVSLGGGYSC